MPTAGSGDGGCVISGLSIDTVNCQVQRRSNKGELAVSMQLLSGSRIRIRPVDPQRRSGKPEPKGGAFVRNSGSPTSSAQRKLA